MRSSVLALLAAATIVSAQRDCRDKEILVESDGDLKFYADGCPEVQTIILGKNVQQVDLGGIRTIKGDFIGEEATECTSIEGASLGEIGGEFRLVSMTRLSSISLPKLASVDRIKFQTLPACSQFGFTREITKAKSVEISDTVLTSLKGINLESCETFDVNNNRYLKEVNMKLETVSNALAITFNAKSVQVGLPNLIWANNCTFRDVVSVKTPSLQTVNGSIGFINCTFEDYAAPNLTDVGEALAFVDCNKLGNVSFPELTEIKGTLLFANNSIKEVEGFPKLDTVEGAVDMSGEFEKCNFDSLKDVRGGFNFQTSSKFDCGAFDQKQSDGTVKGEYLCTAEVKSDELGGLGSQPESGTNSNKKGAAGQIAVSFLTVVGCALFSIAYVL